MKNFQVFASYDPLKDYKVNLLKTHNCMFFEHDTNRVISINCGMKCLDLYHEKIITDGNINVVGRNTGYPSLVWGNEYLSLDYGLSLALEISNSTFFINVVCKNNEVIYEIHMNEETRSNIENIINYIYGNRFGMNTSSLVLYYPDIIKTIDYTDGIKTVNQYFYSDKKRTIKLLKKR